MALRALKEFIASSKPASGWQAAVIIVVMLLPLPLYILLPVGTVVLLMRCLLKYLDTKQDVGRAIRQQNVG
ncbi:hypothetical protein ABIC09_002767 [Bradyrhizobium sp. S3.12.5]